jgi:hypothetical protein
MNAVMYSKKKYDDPAKQKLSAYICVIWTSKVARANSAARFDKVILVYDSFFIFLKSLTLNFHIDIGASISKLVSVHPNFVVWVVLDWWMEI